jgi:hypothetical protein
MNRLDTKQGADKTAGSRIGIFISHRMEDQEIALKLRGKLQEELAKDKVEVHVCIETQGEKSWRNWIEQKIHQSQIMIFLYTVEHEEAWRWCMYEIGMFNGLRMDDENRSLIFLKNPHITELPDPLRDITFYKADKEGIEIFLESLLFEGKHTPQQVKIIGTEDKDAAYDKKFRNALEEINYAFKRSRLSIEYYAYRITIELDLNSTKDRKHRIEKSAITADSKTKDVLNIPSDVVKWKNLRQHFKHKGQIKWIEEVENIAEHVADNQVVERVLHPITIEKLGRKDTYLPVVSSLEKMYPIEEDGTHEPTKINVIFIPQHLGQEGSLERLPTLIPFSKVKFVLDPSNNSHFKQLAEVDDAVQVVEMNDLCLKLYTLNKNEFSFGSNKWSAHQLIERLRELNLVAEGNIEKLIEDQTRVIDELLLKSYPQSEAVIPLQFNNRHPYFPNQCFLPVIANSRIESHANRRQEAHLLIAYVKDFWPADHEENPFNTASMN